jgi:catechol 2,3-dioxygenase-like lactoylglutathione lyase family enzyme
MIDHVSIGVRDLAASARFYASVLQTIGLAQLVARPTTVGFGKTYPEFWLNHRPGMAPVDANPGTHVCLRARDTASVAAFHAAALAGGGSSDGPPGLRPEYNDRYYAAFVRDPEGNRIEAVTFLDVGQGTERSSSRSLPPS